MDDNKETVETLKDKITELDKQIFEIEQSKRFLRMQIKVLRDAEKKAERERRLEKRASKILETVPETVQNKIREKLLR